MRAGPLAPAGSKPSAKLLESPSHEAGEEAWIRYAFRAHPDFAAARTAIAVAAADDDQSERLMDLARSFERLTLGASPTRSRPSGGTQRAEGSFASAPGDSARRERLIAARVAVQRAELSQLKVERAAEVRERAAALRRAREQLAVLDEQIALLERLLRLVEARLETGGAARADGLALQAALVALRRDREAVEEEHLRVGLAFAERVGRHLEGAELLAPADLETASLRSPVLASVERKWPSLERARAVRERARATLALVSDRVRPTLDVGLSRGERGRGRDAGPDRRREQPGARRRAPTMAAQAGPREALLQQLALRVERADASVRATAARRESALRRAHAAWRSAAEDHRVAKEELLPLAQEAADAELERYGARSGGFLEAFAAARRRLELSERVVLSAEKLERARAAFGRAAGLEEMP